MRVGSLVTYKKRKTPELGVIVGKNPLTGHRWIVQWANGMKYSEHEMHLEVICS
jgi:predicted secreted protein